MNESDLISIVTTRPCNPSYGIVQDFVRSQGYENRDELIFEQVRDAHYNRDIKRLTWATCGLSNLGYAKTACKYLLGYKFEDLCECWRDIDFDVFQPWNLAHLFEETKITTEQLAEHGDDFCGNLLYLTVCNDSDPRCFNFLSKMWYVDEIVHAMDPALIDNHGIVSHYNEDISGNLCYDSYNKDLWLEMDVCRTYFNLHIYNGRGLTLYLSSKENGSREYVFTYGDQSPEETDWHTKYKQRLIDIWNIYNGG